MLRLYIVFAISFMLFSCSSPEEQLLKRFDGLIETVERNKDKYNRAQWEKMDNRFEDLLQEYDQLHYNLTDEQRNRIDKLIGKYVALRGKGEVEGLLKEFESGLKQLEGFLEELSE